MVYVTYLFHGDMGWPLLVIRVDKFIGFFRIGTSIMNDFKSMEDDKRFSLNNIPVIHSFARAKHIVLATQITPQLVIAAYLHSIGETSYALALLALLLPQVYFLQTLLMEDSLENDFKYATYFSR